MPTVEDFLHHPIETLERAIELRKRVDQLNEVLKELFGSPPMSSTDVHAAAPKSGGKRSMSADARERIAAAQRARWAKQKGTHAAETAIVLEAAKAKKQRGAATGKPSNEADVPQSQPAKAKAGSSSKSSVKARGKKKRHLSPEARARISAAAKARWAREKKSQ
ncbi:MAG TPA: hypothetical protein VGM54_02455 [Chthoniobacter sp.]|jgi:hypothetical protein